MRVLIKGLVNALRLVLSESTRQNRESNVCQSGFLFSPLVRTSTFMFSHTPESETSIFPLNTSIFEACMRVRIKGLVFIDEGFATRSE